MPKGVYIRKSKPVAPTITTRPWQERFEAKVRRSSDPEECDVWTASTDRKGYGKLQLGTLKEPKYGMAPRLAWEMANGPIPEGRSILHKCDNPSCVKPSHLFIGTKADNGRDMSEKGRSLRGERANNARLTDEKVLEARRLYATGVLNMSALARKWGVSTATISYVVHGKTWGHVK